MPSLVTEAGKAANRESGVRGHGAGTRVEKAGGIGGKKTDGEGGGGGRRLEGGEEVRDGYSRGLRADRASERKKPYQCDRCEASFGIAPDLSEHFHRLHGVTKHPSQIVPTAVIF